MFLKIYQIYFKESQLHMLEREYIPFLNEECTIFFENSVIKSLIISGAADDCEYFGAVSYKLRNKIGSVMKERWGNQPVIANHSVKEFSPATFENELKSGRPDVMSFQRHMSHDPVSHADNYHPFFSEYFRQVMRAIGYEWSPTRFENVFYCNFFAARAEIYKAFVKDMLIPAMEVMKSMPDLMKDSRYPNPLPADLAIKWGITWYPYHAFLCERMFSYYAFINNLQCLHF